MHAFANLANALCDSFICQIIDKKQRLFSEIYPEDKGSTDMNIRIWVFTVATRRLIYTVAEIKQHVVRKNFAVFPEHTVGPLHFLSLLI